MCGDPVETHARRDGTFAGSLRLISVETIDGGYGGKESAKTRGNTQHSSRTGGARQAAMIRKLSSGGYRLYSRKVNPKTHRRRNLGTFKTRAAAEKHERAVQYFKRH